MLRGAVIGLGRMGVTHFSLLNIHPDVTMVAGCDTSKFVLKNFEKYGNIDVFTDVESMFKKSDFDFVIIATPTRFHKSNIELAYEKKVHVFVEKPLAVDSTQAQELATVASQHETVNQVGYFLRFNPIFNHIKRLLEMKALGNLIYYKNEMYGRTVLYPSKSSWRGKKEMGGGCLLDFGSHCIDLSHYLFGNIDDVQGTVFKEIYSEAIEDAVYSTVNHHTGLTGHIMVNWSDASYRRPYNRIEIVGDNGRIIADRQECRLFLKNSVGALEEGWSVKYLPELDEEVRFSIRGTDFTAQLDHFIECVKSPDKANNSPFQDAFNTNHVIDMMKAQAR